MPAQIGGELLGEGVAHADVPGRVVVRAAAGEIDRLVAERGADGPVLGRAEARVDFHVQAVVGADAGVVRRVVGGGAQRHRTGRHGGGGLEFPFHAAATTGLVDVAVVDGAEV